jgi:hypothetical protein
MIRKREEIHPQTIMIQLQQPFCNRQEETEAKREAKMSGLEEFVSITVAPPHRQNHSSPPKLFQGGDD